MSRSEQNGSFLEGSDNCEPNTIYLSNKAASDQRIRFRVLDPFSQRETFAADERNVQDTLEDHERRFVVAVVGANANFLRVAGMLVFVLCATYLIGAPRY